MRMDESTMNSQTSGLSVTDNADLTHARSVIRDLSEALEGLFMYDGSPQERRAQAVLTKHAAEIERCK